MRVSPSVQTNTAECIFIPSALDLKKTEAEFGGISPLQPVQPAFRCHFSFRDTSAAPSFTEGPLKVSSSTVPTTATAFAGLSISMGIVNLSLTGN